MAFWTQVGRNTSSPKTQDLFLVNMQGVFEDEVLWFAKNVTKPSVQFEANSGPQAGAFALGGGLAGQKVGYINPGALQAFSPIDLTLIDPNGDKKEHQVTERLMEYLELNAKTKDHYGLSNASRGFGTFSISQLAHLTPRDLTGQLQAGLDIASAIVTGVTNPNVAANALAATQGVTAASTLRNSNLRVAERWTLYQAHILSVDFGSLDYSADGFIEIKCSIGYTGFDVEFGSAGGQKTTYAFGNKPK